MDILLVAFAGDFFFVVSLAMMYFVLTRRRAKIYILVEHLASLARSGLPLQAGLRVLAADLGGFFGTRVTRAARQIEEGNTLSVALGSMPATFPPVLRSMVDLGEKSGNLGAFLEEMRRSYRRLVELPFQTLNAFVYPMAISLCLAASVALLYFQMKPKMDEVLYQMQTSNHYSVWWPRLVIAQQAVLAACIALALFVLLGGFTAHFGFPIFRPIRRLLDRAILWMPFFGTIARDRAAHHVSLCAGLFLRAGASLPDAVAAAAGSERNDYFRSRLAGIEAQLGEGARFSDVLRRERLFPDDLLWFVESGEAAGSLPDHLLQAAAHYETRVRLALQVASRAVVPVFVLLNGLLVLATSLLIYLPIFQIERAVIPP